MADVLSLDVGLQLDESSMNDFKSNLQGALGSVGSALSSGISAVGSAVSAVGSAAVDAGKEIFDLAQGCAAAGDKIDKQSQALGLSREAYQEWDYILSQNGTSIDAMGKSMKTLNNLVDDARNGAASATAKFDRLGISMADLEGKSQEEIFEMTITALQGVEDASERAAIANDVLGGSSVQMAALLNSGADSVKNLKNQAHDMGIIMEDEAVDASIAFTDSMDNLTRSFGAFKNKIGAAFLPGITNITDGLTKLMSGNYDEGLELISEGVNTFVDTLSTTIENGVGLIGELLPTLLPALGQAFISLVQGVMNILIEQGPVIADTVVSLVTMFAQFLLENLPLIITAAIQIIVALAEGISENIESLIPVAVDAVIMIVETLIENLPLLIQAALVLVQALANGIIAALPELVAKLPELIWTITDFIAFNLPEIVKMGIEVIIALAGGIIQAIPQLVAQMPQLITAIITAIGGAVVGVTQVGKNIVEGLWKGISQMGSWIKEKVKGFFSGIIDSAKNLLGIHSPSTVFAGIGGFMSEGLGIGFEAEMPNINEMIQSEIPTNAELSTDLNISKNLKTSLDKASKSGKGSSSYGNIVLEFNGNTFTDKAGLKKVAQDLKAILQEDGLRTGSVVFA